MKDKQSQLVDPVDDWIDRVITAVMRRAGKSLAEAETRAGVAPGYLRKARGGPRNIMLMKLLRICREARIDPGEIFAEVLGSPTERIELSILTSKTPKPAILRQLERRLANEESKLASPPLAQTWLDELDELRYNDPVRALATVEQAIDFLALEHLPRALGVWASAARLQVRLHEGWLVSKEGLRLARELGRESDEADLLRRQSFLLGSFSANWHQPLLLSDQALAIFVRCGNTLKMGQVLVDQGVILGYLKRLVDARSAFSSALNLLDEGDRRHRFASLYGLANVSQLCGKPERALREADQAASLASAAFERGKLAWLQGRALGDMHRWEECLVAFTNVFDILFGVSPIDTALSVCDHVRALLGAGKLEEARRRSEEMRRLIVPLSTNRFASKALRDLLCAEQEGEALTVALITTIRQRIEASRRAGSRRL